MRRLETLAVKANEVLRKHTGFCVRRLPVSFDDFRLELIKRHSIDLIVDGGANQGQWALRLLDKLQKLHPRHGDGPISAPPLIVSIEPFDKAFGQLLELSKSRTNWIALQCALGAKNEIGILNIASNDGQSSSLRAPKEHLSSYSTVNFQGAESVRIRRLDDIPEISKGKAIWLKLDIQGFEKEAILGADGILSAVSVIEIETAFREMYEGQSSHLELLNLLDSAGFRISRFSDPGTDANGEMLYLDVIATRFRR